MQDTENSNEQNVKAIYNEAGEQISRLSKIWSDCHNYRLSSNFSGWVKALESAWAELAPNPKTKPNHEKIYNKNIKNIALAFKTKSKERIWPSLIKHEIFLRKLQEEQDRGAAYKDDSDGDFE